MSSSEDSSLSDVGLYEDTENVETTQDIDLYENMENVERTPQDVNLYEDLEVDETAQHDGRWTRSITDINDESNMSMFDLYSELITDEHKQAEASYKDLQKQYACSCEELFKTEAEIKRLINDNTCLSKKNLCIQKNITSLFLTAKAEIQRKDREIGELRSNSDYWKTRAVKARRTRDIYRSELQTERNNSNCVLSPVQTSVQDKITEDGGLSATNNKLCVTTEADSSVSICNSRGKRDAIQLLHSKSLSRNVDEDRQSNYNDYFESRDVNRKRKMETDKNDTRQKSRLEQYCVAKEDPFQESEEVSKGNKSRRLVTRDSDRYRQQGNSVRYHSSVDASLSHSEKQRRKSHDAIIEKSLQGSRQRTDDKHCYCKSDSYKYEKYLPRKCHKGHKEIHIYSREIKEKDGGRRKQIPKRNPSTKEKKYSNDYTNHSSYAHRSINRNVSESNSRYSQRRSSLDAVLTEYSTNRFRNSADGKLGKDSKSDKAHRSSQEKYTRKNKLRIAEKGSERKRDVDKLLVNQSNDNSSDTDVSDASNNYCREKKRSEPAENSKESNAEILDVLPNDSESSDDYSDTEQSTSNTSKTISIKPTKHGNSHYMKIDNDDPKPLPCKVMKDEMVPPRQSKSLTRTGESVGISDPCFSCTDIVGNTGKMVINQNKVQSGTAPLSYCTHHSSSMHRSINRNVGENSSGNSRRSNVLDVNMTECSEKRSMKSSADEKYRIDSRSDTSQEWYTAKDKLSIAEKGLQRKRKSDKRLDYQSSDNSSDTENHVVQVSKASNTSKLLQHDILGDAGHELVVKDVKESNEISVDSKGKKHKDGEHRSLVLKKNPGTKEKIKNSDHYAHHRSSAHRSSNKNVSGSSSGYSQQSSSLDVDLTEYSTNRSLKSADGKLGKDSKSDKAHRSSQEKYTRKNKLNIAEKGSERKRDIDKLLVNQSNDNSSDVSDGSYTYSYCRKKERSEPARKYPAENFEESDAEIIDVLQHNNETLSDDESHTEQTPAKPTKYSNSNRMKINREETKSLPCKVMKDEMVTPRQNKSLTRTGESVGIYDPPVSSTDVIDSTVCSPPGRIVRNSRKVKSGMASLSSCNTSQNEGDSEKQVQVSKITKSCKVLQNDVLVGTASELVVKVMKEDKEECVESNEIKQPVLKRNPDVKKEMTNSETYVHHSSSAYRSVDRNINGSSSGYSQQRNSLDVDLTEYSANKSLKLSVDEKLGKDRKSDKKQRSSHEKYTGKNKLSFIEKALRSKRNIDKRLAHQNSDNSSDIDVTDRSNNYCWKEKQSEPARKHPTKNSDAEILDVLPNDSESSDDYSDTEQSTSNTSKTISNKPTKHGNSHYMKIYSDDPKPLPCKVMKDEMVPPRQSKSLTRTGESVGISDPCFSSTDIVGNTVCSPSGKMVINRNKVQSGMAPLSLYCADHSSSMYRSINRNVGENSSGNSRRRNVFDVNFTECFEKRSLNSSADEKYRIDSRSDKSQEWYTAKDKLSIAEKGLQRKRNSDKRLDYQSSDNSSDTENHVVQVSKASNTCKLLQHDILGDAGHELVVKDVKESNEISADSKGKKHKDGEHRSLVLKKNPGTKEKIKNCDHYAHHRSSAHRSSNKNVSGSSSGYSQQSSSLDVDLTEYSTNRFLKSADGKLGKDSKSDKAHRSSQEKYTRINKLRIAEKGPERKRDVDKRLVHQSSDDILNSDVSDTSNNYCRKEEQSEPARNSKESDAEIIDVLQHNNETLSDDESDTEQTITNTSKTNNIKPTNYSNSNRVKINRDEPKPLPCKMMKDKMVTPRQNKSLTRTGESVGIYDPCVSSTDVIDSTVCSPPEKMVRHSREVKSGMAVLSSCNTSQSEGDSEEHVMQVLKISKSCKVLHLQNDVFFDTASELVVKVVKENKDISVDSKGKKHKDREHRSSVLKKNPGTKEKIQNSDNYAHHSSSAQRSSNKNVSGSSSGYSQRSSSLDVDLIEYSTNRFLKSADGKLGKDSKSDKAHRSSQEKYTRKNKLRIAEKGPERKRDVDKRLVHQSSDDIWNSDVSDTSNNYCRKEEQSEPARNSKESDTEIIDVLQHNNETLSDDESDTEQTITNTSKTDNIKPTNYSNSNRMKINREETKPLPCKEMKDKMLTPRQNKALTRTGESVGIYDPCVSSTDVIDSTVCSPPRKMVRNSRDVKSGMAVLSSCNKSQSEGDSEEHVVQVLKISKSCSELVVKVLKENKGECVESNEIKQPVLKRNPGAKKKTTNSDTYAYHSSSTHRSVHRNVSESNSEYSERSNSLDVNLTKYCKNRSLKFSADEKYRKGSRSDKPHGSLQEQFMRKDKLSTREKNHRRKRDIDKRLQHQSIGNISDANINDRSCNYYRKKEHSEPAENSKESDAEIVEVLQNDEASSDYDSDTERSTNNTSKTVNIKPTKHKNGNDRKIDRDEPKPLPCKMMKDKMVTPRQNKSLTRTGESVGNYDPCVSSTDVIDSTVCSPPEKMVRHSREVKSGMAVLSSCNTSQSEGDSEEHVMQVLKISKSCKVLHLQNDVFFDTASELVVKVVKESKDISVDSKGKKHKDQEHRSPVLKKNPGTKEKIQNYDNYAHHRSSAHRSSNKNVSGSSSGYSQRSSSLDVDLTEYSTNRSLKSADGKLGKDSKSDKAHRSSQEKYTRKNKLRIAEKGSERKRDVDKRLVHQSSDDISNTDVSDTSNNYCRKEEQSEPARNSKKSDAEIIDVLQHNNETLSDDESDTEQTITNTSKSDNIKPTNYSNSNRVKINREETKPLPCKVMKDEMVTPRQNKSLTRTGESVGIFDPSVSSTDVIDSTVCSPPGRMVRNSRDVQSGMAVLSSCNTSQSEGDSEEHVVQVSKTTKTHKVLQNDIFLDTASELVVKVVKESKDISVDSKGIKHEDGEHRSPVLKKNPGTKEKIKNSDNYAHHRSSAQRSSNKNVSGSSSRYSQRSSSLDVELTDYSANRSMKLLSVDEKLEKDNRKDRTQRSSLEKFMRKDKLSNTEKSHQKKRDIDKKLKHQSSKNISDADVTDRSNNYCWKEKQSEPARKHPTKNPNAEIINASQNDNESSDDYSDTDRSTSNTSKTVGLKPTEHSNSNHVKINSEEPKPLPCKVMKDEIVTPRRNKALTRTGESEGISDPRVSCTDVIDSTPTRKVVRNSSEVKSGMAVLSSCNTSQSEGDSEEHVVQVSKTTKTYKALQSDISVGTASELVVKDLKVDKGFGKKVRISKSMSDVVMKHNFDKMMTKDDPHDTKNVELIDNLSRNFKRRRDESEEGDEKVRKLNKPSSSESFHFQKKECAKEKSLRSTSSAKISHSEKRDKSASDTHNTKRSIKHEGSSKLQNSFEKSKKYTEKLQRDEIHSVSTTLKISRKYEAKQSITDSGLVGNYFNYTSPKQSEKQKQVYVELESRSEDADGPHRHSIEGSRSKGHLSYSEKKCSYSIHKANKNKSQDKEGSSKSKLKLPPKIIFESEEGSLLEDSMIELLSDGSISSEPEPASLVCDSVQLDVDRSQGFGRKIISNSDEAELRTSRYTMSTEGLQAEKDNMELGSLTCSCDTKTGIVQKEKSLSLKRAKDGEFMDEIEKWLLLLDSKESDIGTQDKVSVDSDKFSFKDILKKVEISKHDKHNGSSKQPSEDSSNRTTKSFMSKVHSKQCNMNCDKERVEKSDKFKTPDMKKKSKQTSERSSCEDIGNITDIVETAPQMSCSTNISSSSRTRHQHLENVETNPVVQFQKEDQKFSENEESVIFKVDGKQEPRTDIDTEPPQSIIIIETLKNSTMKNSKVEKSNSESMEVKISESSRELKSLNFINCLSDSDSADNAGPDMSSTGASKYSEVHPKRNGSQHSLNQPALHLSPYSTLYVDLLLSSESETETDFDEESGSVNNEFVDESKAHSTEDHANIDDKKHERKQEVQIKNDTTSFENKGETVNASMPNKDTLFNVANDDLEEGEICDSEDKESEEKTPAPKTIMNLTMKNVAKQKIYIIPKHNDHKDKLIRKKSQERFKGKVCDSKEKIPHNQQKHFIEWKENKYPTGKLSLAKKYRSERNQRDLYERIREDCHGIRETDHDGSMSDSKDRSRSSLGPRDRDRSSLDAKDYGRSRLDCNDCDRSRLNSNYCGRSRLDSKDCDRSSLDAKDYGRSRVESNDCGRSKLDLRVMKSQVKEKSSRIEEKNHSQSKQEDNFRSRHQSREKL